MSARFRARAPGPVSGQLCRAPAGRAGHDGAGFLLPFGRRPSLLGHPVPPGDSAPLTIGLPHRQQAARTRAGFPCSARVRCGRDRVPSVPRGRRCPHGHACIPWPPPAALSTAGPCHPGTATHPGMFSSRGISKGSLAFTPPGHSPHLWLPDGTGTLGLYPGLHTRLSRTQPRMPGRGRASGTGPG
jgi:hypothetical protein